MEWCGQAADAAVMIARCSRAAHQPRTRHHCVTLSDSLLERSSVCCQSSVDEITSTVPAMSVTTLTRSSVVLAILLVTWAVIGPHGAGGCYVFPPDMVDPCRDKRCSFGAQCVPSLDGLTARCQCPQRCHNYGDNYGDSVTATVTVLEARRCVGPTVVTTPTRAKCDGRPAVKWETLRRSTTANVVRSLRTTHVGLIAYLINRCLSSITFIWKIVM